MENLDLEKFDPTTADLTAMVLASKKIEITDFKDKKQLEIVKAQRIELKKARVTITNRGKELREDALKFQRAVIGKEKELIAIIEPEELRLAELEERAKNLLIIEERKRKYPEREVRLKTIGDWDGVEMNVDYVTMMDDVTFETYFNSRVTAKNARDAASIAEAKRKADEEFAESQRKAKEESEKKQKDLEMREAKLHEAEREAAHKKEVEEAAGRARKEAEEKAAYEKKRDAEAAEAEKQHQIAVVQQSMKAKKFVAWMKENGCTNENKDEWMTTDTEKEIVLFKKVATFKR